MSAVSNLVAVLEFGLLLTGLILLWRVVLSPTARQNRLPSPLDTWTAPVSQFFLFLAYVFLGTTAVSLAASLLGRSLPLEGDARVVFAGAAAQLGMVTGVAVYHFTVERIRSSATPAAVGIVRSGVVTFLISLPILTATSLAWQAFLELSGLPVERQDLIRMFAHADSPGLLLAMMTLAVIVAPIAEELVFRAGLFRYFRTRMSRSVALVAPALFFAVLHVGDWRTLEGFASLAPLAVLAIVYSIAYERTGRIGTAMVAHGLFNLNTIVLILAGLGV